MRKKKAFILVNKYFSIFLLLGLEVFHFEQYKCDGKTGSGKDSKRTDIAQDEKLWRDMIAYLLKGYGT